MDLKEHLTKLAEQHGTGFVRARNSDTLMDLDGVGCLLRYLSGNQAIHLHSA